MFIPDCSGKKYSVLGWGKSGMAAAAALRDSGAEVAAWDDGEAGRSAIAAAGYAVENPALPENVRGLEAMILAPGIPYTHPAPHPAVLACRAAGAEVMGDVDLLFRACPDATYIGITGTNGKSTTTSLIAHILKESGRDVQAGGNLGTPALELAPLGKGGVYALELSSFQLDLLRRNPLRVAALLNITPDHIDRHGDMAGYAVAKRRIAENLGGETGERVFVLGTDEPETQALAEWARRQSGLRVKEISVRHKVTEGVAFEGGRIFVYKDGKGEPVADMADFKTLPGVHNAQNVCAALAVCDSLGLGREEIVRGIATFPGLAHRQQLVAEIRGARFVNDSKATNADAAEKALACYENIYWIIGGKPKASGLDGLEGYMARVRRAFLIGMASDRFAEWLEKNGVSYTRCETLDKATKAAAETAWRDGKAGAVVLLSPACASFDQFSGFEERGRMFVEFVERLKMEKTA